MPRGRPRKNPLPDTVVAPVEEAKKIPEEKPEFTPPKGYEGLTQAQYEKLPVCDRCHKKILNGDRIINITYLTSMAPWHREVGLDKVTLCPECIKELNTMVDAWLINNGKGVKTKFPK